MSTDAIKTQQAINKSEIETWLISYVAEILEIAPEEINITNTIEQYGLDSRTALGMIADLEDTFNCEIDPSVIYNSPTLLFLAEYVLAHQIEI